MFLVVVVVVVFIVLGYFGILLFIDFGYLSKNISQNFGHCKKTKMKNAEKKDILTRAVSTGVLANSVFFCFSFWCFFDFACFAESTIKIKVSAKNTKKNKTVCSKLVQGCVKNWSKYVAQENWTSS